MDWKPYELEDPITSYTMKLHRGLKIERLTCDEQGRPVAGARIGFTGPGAKSAEREKVVLYSRLSETGKRSEPPYVGFYQFDEHRLKDHVGRSFALRTPWLRRLISRVR
jgi:hypothetical protein